MVEQNVGHLQGKTDSGKEPGIGDLPVKMIHVGHKNRKTDMWQNVDYNKWEYL